MFSENGCYKDGSLEELHHSISNTSDFKALYITVRKWIKCFKNGCCTVFSENHYNMFQL